MNTDPCDDWSTVYKPRRITIAEIQRAVAQEFGVAVEDITGPNRARKYARPRQVAMFLAYEMTAASLPAIGRRFNRDHTTVLHSVFLIRDLANENIDMEERLVRTRKRLVGT